MQPLDLNSAEIIMSMEGSKLGHVSLLSDTQAETSGDETFDEKFEDSSLANVKAEKKDKELVTDAKHIPRKRSETIQSQVIIC